LVLIYRNDRTLSQIIELDKEIQLIILINDVQTLAKQGISKAEIAALYKMSSAELEKIISINMRTLAVSSDAQSYARGEFFYQLRNTSKSGFFITSVPRGQNLKFYVEKQGFRTLHKNMTSSSGLYQDLGRVKIFQY